MVGESRPPPRTPLSELFRTLGENSFGETETSHPKKVPTLYRQDLLKSFLQKLTMKRIPTGSLQAPATVFCGGMSASELLISD